MAAQALELCCTVMSCAGARAQCGKDLAAVVNERVQPRALELVKSPLLQGQALLVSGPVFPWGSAARPCAAWRRFAEGPFCVPHCWTLEGSFWEDAAQIWSP